MRHARRPCDPAPRLQHLAVKRHRPAGCAQVLAAHCSRCARWAAAAWPAAPAMPAHRPTAPSRPLGRASLARHARVPPLPAHLTFTHPTAVLPGSFVDNSCQYKAQCANRPNSCRNVTDILARGAGGGQGVGLGVRGSARRPRPLQRWRRWVARLVRARAPCPSHRAPVAFCPTSRTPNLTTPSSRRQPARGPAARWPRSRATPVAARAARSATAGARWREWDGRGARAVFLPARPP